MATLDIKRRSATTTQPPSVRQSLPVAKLIDLSRCIGCKACQAACEEWNDVREPIGANVGVYDNPVDLTEHSWTVMKFKEEEIGGDLQWLISKMGCLHCEDPGCLKACPAPGAIVQYANGIVDFNQEKCIGCGYCASGCPFNIPRYSHKDNKAYKCTLCSDRVQVGVEPACVKSCPTQALSFGSKETMLGHAEQRLADLVERGLAKAAIYDPPGVGGTHVVYVLPHGDRPESYGLPKNPTTGKLLALWRGGAARTLGVVTMVGVVVAGVFHYFRHGPLEVPEDKNPPPPSNPPSEKRAES